MTRSFSIFGFASEASKNYGNEVFRNESRSPYLGRMNLSFWASLSIYVDHSKMGESFLTVTTQTFVCFVTADQNNHIGREGM